MIRGINLTANLLWLIALLMAAPTQASATTDSRSGFIGQLIGVDGQAMVVRSDSGSKTDTAVSGVLFRLSDVLLLKPFSRVLFLFRDGTKAEVSSSGTSREVTIRELSANRVRPMVSGPRAMMTRSTMNAVRERSPVIPLSPRAGMLMDRPAELQFLTVDQEAPESIIVTISSAERVIHTFVIPAGHEGELHAASLPNLKSGEEYTIEYYGQRAGSFSMLLLGYCFEIADAADSIWVARRQNELGSKRDRVTDQDMIYIDQCIELRFFDLAETEILRCLRSEPDSKLLVHYLDKISGRRGEMCR